MYISITYAGVEGHIDGIREELRNVRRLRDQLRNLYGQVDNSLVDPKLLRNCVDELQLVEESMCKRMGFLSGLVTDMRQLNAEIGSIIDRM